MPWAMETKAGFGWATAITILFLASIWAMVTYKNPAPLLIPILAYLGFLAWIGRVK